MIEPRDAAEARDQALDHAYRNALYAVRLDAVEIVLRIGQYDADADRPLCHGLRLRRCWSIVTPANPGSRPLTAVDNQRRLRRLIAALARLQQPWAPSIGRDPYGRWPDEAGVLLCDPPPDRAEALGRAFGQNAIVNGQPGAAPVLVWLETGSAGT